MLDVINRYLHGYVAIPVIVSLIKRGLLKRLREGPVSLEELIQEFRANPGHLHTALHMFESLGWLLKSQTGFYSLTMNESLYNDCLKIPDNILVLYKIPVQLLLTKSKYQKIVYGALRYLLDKNHENETIIDQLIEGAVTVPLLLSLRMNYFPEEKSSFELKNITGSIQEVIVDFFKYKNWMSENNELNEAGNFMISRSFNMALAASYRFMLSEVNELIFGNQKRVFRKNIFGKEKYIDRSLHALATEFQHVRFYEDLEEIILDIFNKLPLSDQPKYIIDIGCGDGSLLKKLYEIISVKSNRGKQVEQYPLYVIAVDVNPQVLRRADETLRDIPHLSLIGDVSDPLKLIKDLHQRGITDADNSLQVRAFLDHERSYIPPQNVKKLHQKSLINFSNIYVDRDGQMIPAASMVQSLVEHFSRWSSIISRHGLLILEVHRLTANVAAAHFDSESFYFDTLQSFSRQYAVTADTFFLSAAEVGLFPNMNYSKRYPQALPYTRITLNYFEKRNYTLDYAQQEDIKELLIIEEQCWIGPLRITYEEIQKRIRQYPQGQFVVRINHKVVGVIYSQPIHSEEVLQQASFKDISRFYDPDGKVMQLIGINILPEIENRGIGEQLLELFLYWTPMIGDIEKVVCVTRCKNYLANKEISLSDYIKIHSDRPDGIDPILRFHTSHGATIKGIIPNYRPEDKDNFGTGVLVEYDIYSPIEKKTIYLKEEIEGSTLKTVNECVLQLIPEKFRNNYSEKIPLRDLGFDSLRLLELRTLLKKKMSIQLDPTFFFQQNTPLAMSQYLDSMVNIVPQPIEKKYINENNIKENDIAIIGVGCRFPGNVNNIDDFWRILKDKTDAVTKVPANRWVGRENDSVNFGAFLEDIDKFDADFFHISPREAELMDPQQRILLEVTWEALEQAGIAAENLKETKTGVYVGVFSHDYENLIEKNIKTEKLDAYFGTGNSESVLAGRISYFFGLQGPSLVVNTACSSSLVAVHLACEGLLHNESDIALAAGVNLILLPDLSVSFAKAGMLAPDGKCKTFDAAANGYVRGEGCGVLILKKLNKAIEDNDSILAVIRGTWINQDGTSNGLTAPNVISQEDLLKRALISAKIEPQLVSYIETHGTGTPLGDPVEIKAITAVYGENRKKENPLFLGSVKTNIGHTEGAAGIAGLIKTILILQNKEIPANLHFNKLNPYINLNDVPIVIPQKLTTWKKMGKNPRLGSVSSFGFSGTNAHVIVEEFPNFEKKVNKHKSSYLLTLSAKTENALNQKIKDITKWIEVKLTDKNQDENMLENVAYTLNTGRNHFEIRCAIVVDSVEELQKTLAAYQNNSPSDNMFISLHKSKSPDRSIFKELLKKIFQEIKMSNQITSQDYREKLLTLANFYIEGYGIDWDLLHQNEFKTKISLPVYPFERRSYWYDNQHRQTNLELTSHPKDQRAVLKINTIKNVGRENIIKEHVAKVLYKDVKDIQFDKSFADMGMDSVLGVELIKKLNQEFDMNLTASKIYDFPTLELLSKYIDSQVEEEKISIKRESEEEINQYKETDIAIIGMACQFPGAKNVNEFWEILINGKSAITEIPKIRWSTDNFYNSEINNPNTSISKWGGFLEEVDKFDPLFFSISPSDAEWMDPQQRLILQTAWEALEDAGYSSNTVSNSICGIYAGVMNNDYLELIAKTENLNTNAPQLMGNSNSILASRISYFLNLKGPAVTIDTACSSSLVAVHLACRSLQLGEANMMLAGGVTVYLNESSYIRMSKAGMLSPEGKCKTFDNNADGFVPGEGVGVIVLKRLSDAVRDHDCIYGVIKGSAINQDGKTNGITAPSANSQKELELLVYDRYKINPETIDYVEAHGTGTKLGDPIEVEALTGAFENFTTKKQFCAIGSVKTNIGHTSAAAGVASIIKVLLCLNNHKLVPTLNFRNENDQINFKDSPFFVNTNVKNWYSESEHDNPRLAAISSFGFSGTNAHLVIQEAPKLGSKNYIKKPAYLIVFSAKRKEDLNQKLKDFELWLKQASQEINIEDISYTLSHGRTHFNFRCAFVVESLQEFNDLLELVNKGESPKGYVFNENNNFNQTLSSDFYISLNKGNYRNKLLLLADFYVQGGTVEWDKLYEGEEKRKISLPTYPFCKKSYWIPQKEIHTPKADILSSDIHLYTPIWKNKTVTTSDKKTYGKVFIIDQNKHIYHALKQHSLIQDVRWFSPENINLLEVKNLDYLIYVSQDDAKKDYIAIFEISKKVIHSTRHSFSLWFLIEKHGTYLEAFSGFAKTLSLEHSRINTKVIQLEHEEDLIDEFNQSLHEVEVKYDNEHRRFIKKYEEILFSSKIKPLIKKKGTYLITGGVGALGIIFSKYLVENYQANLILTGRSALNEKQKNILNSLRRNNVDIVYLTNDIASFDDSRVMIQHIFEKYKKIDGIIHAAGIIHDSSLLKKSFQESHEVLSAKIQGTVNLDEITRTHPLDFFVMFSSVASITGNIGQIDYAYANGFLDGFAQYREILRKQNKRQGHTISINWPLWSEGGMQIDQTKKKWLLNTLGLRELATKEGLAVFNQILGSKVQQVAVMSGNVSNFFRTLSKAESSSSQTSEISSLKSVESQLIDMLSNLLKLSPDEIDPAANFSEYGIDSINMTQLTNQINEFYHLELSPTLLFEHKNLTTFSRYLAGQVSSLLPEASVATPLKLKKSLSKDIAIIGMNGIFPGSPNLEVFWENLLEKRDLITEIPSSRWDLNGFYGDNIHNKSISKWGGFVNEIDEFDADFFNISRLEAEMMDPQQRLFLQVVWKTLESAGYTSKKLKDSTVGVFAGIGTFDYAELLQKKKEISGYGPTGILHSVLSNRISYYFNFTGPSESIDTACSSSLVAIHQALNSILIGDCDVAIAGGVNALLTPSLFLEFSHAEMLSKDGKCKTFDKTANGYVRGEGAAAILLKPLDKALADNDIIYGVIKASAVNHGGRVSSLTVPNPNAQANLIVTAVERADIKADTISYIETHGTGTPLGDPIEINGLKKAFQTLQEKQSLKKNNSYCALGSVKTNIGHLEAAAGIAGVIKILLAMQHKKIPGNVHFHDLNPHINIENSPFFIVTDTIDWKHLTYEEGDEVPFRAGISSFGFGGANCHLIIEEAPYVNKLQLPAKPFYIVTLSAKSEHSLNQYLLSLKSWLKNNNNLSIEDISYISNLGREQFEYRCAIVVNSTAELLDVLENPSQPSTSSRIFINKNPIKKNIKSELANKIIREIKDNNFTSNEYYQKLLTLAKLFIKGRIINWDSLHEGEENKKISFPTYPFSKEKYWISSQNQSYEFFKTKDSYLSDHKIKNEVIFPAAGYINIIWQIYPDNQVLSIKNLIFSNKIIFTEPTKNIYLNSQSDNSFVFITKKKESENVIHAQGKISTDYKESKPVFINIDKLKENFPKKQEKGEIYRDFYNIGLQYGPNFQLIKYWVVGDNEALSNLELPGQISDQEIINTTILDAAFQTVYALLKNINKNQLYLPFSIGLIEKYSPIVKWRHVYVKRVSERFQSQLFKFDIKIIDEMGLVLVGITDFVVRAAEVQTNLLDVDHNTNLQNQTENYLKTILASFLKSPIERFDSNQAFEKYGIDSIMIVNLNRQLEKIFGDLPKTLFFEHQDLKSLASYFIKNYKNVLLDKFKIDPGSYFEKKSNIPLKIINKEIKQPLQAGENLPNEIAIIGLAGNYPESDSLAQLWENLKTGKDSIIEIPLERWDYKKFFDSNKNKEDKTNSKWGSFLKDIDKFDPLFFNIAPNEADLIDPQERLFLETAWNTVEDAGYSRDSLAGKSIGVFVGIMYGEYQLFAPEAESSYASVANRVSYTLDWRGPSVGLDTMCSSSLTAIQMACDSIRLGRCQMAMAGGVNLTIHPNKYLQLSHGKFLSSKGRCESFGEGGDGYVPGEGVGAILLKPLAKALEDGDHIYGVIKAVSVNHGGKTNGYTVPNPVAQGELIKATFQEAGIEPFTVNYIEAHGTGTSLGDPIEIAGLTKVFTKEQEGFTCAIGSVKSNIGHLESAAGIAAVTKVLLQLQHHQLVPSIHSKTLNPNINFSKTPFKVQQTLEEWKPVDGYPLRAGISSFGAGGSNAHVIIEEAPALPVKESVNKPAYLFTLSAKSEYSLKEKIKELSAWLDDHDASLADISFTLNAGRSHFDLRCAVVAGTKEELRESLDKLKDQQKIKNAFITFAPIEEQEDAVIYKKVFKQIMQELSDGQALSSEEYRDNLLALAKFYTKGYELDWEALHQGESKRRVSLPGYPFLKKRCWVKNVVEPPLPSPLLQQKTLEEREQEAKDVVGELYDEVFLEAKDKATTQQYLTFGPLREIIPEFSWSSSFLSGEQQNIVINAQREMRDILFRRVDFNECKKVLDFGCGYGNDLIQLALDYPHLELCGYTISKEQSWVGNNNIKKNNLTDRVTIYQRDSAIEAFPDNYDVIFGFEVAHHIKNKDALFENISHHLTKTGKLILADFISHEEYPIEHEKTSSYFITRKNWAELLTTHHLQLVECIDVSQEIANFLHDDQFDKNFEAIINSAVKDAFLSYHQLEKLLREKMASYVLLTAIPASSDMSDTELRHYNEDILQYAIPYKEISEEKEWLYQKVWKKKEVSKPGDLKSRKVVVVTTKENEKLAEGLKNKSRAEYFVIDKNKLDKQEWMKLFTSIKGSGEVQDVIFLTNFSSAVVSEARDDRKIAQDDNLINAFQEKSLHMLAMLQAMASTYSKNPPKVWFVTKGVENGQLDQSAIPIMAKTFSLEIPNFKTSSIDIDPSVTEDKILDGILNAMACDENEILLDKEGIKIAKLEKIKRELENTDVNNDQQINYDSNATALITGAFGGLGMQILQYYIRQGIKHFLLIARHSPSEVIANKLNQYKEEGIQIVTAEVDVADKKSLGNILKQHSNEMPPIQYVAHIAGVIKDSAILNQTQDNFERVIQTKAKGAWNLHEITKDWPIKEFTLFSSVAGILGSPGQINYAAANAFVEALAKHRRCLNLPAKTIAWGAWAEVGMAAQMAPKAHLGLIKLGAYDIAPKQGIRAYAMAQALDLSNVMIAPIDWERFLKATSISLIDPFVIPSQAQGQALSEAKDLPATKKILRFAQSLPLSLRRDDKGTATQKFKPMLRTYVSEITGIDLHEINDKSTFAQMGIDSVMGMKLRNRIQSYLGDQIKIPANIVYEHPTIHDLSAYLEKTTQTIPQPDTTSHQTRFKISELVDENNSLEKEILNIIHQGSGVWREGDEIVLHTLKNSKLTPTKILEKLEDNKKYYPLSSSQEVMCIQSELFKNLSYQLSTAFYINETVDLSLLEKSLNQVVERHEILRTVFPKVGHQLVQVILPDLGVKLESIDLSNLDSHSQQMKVEELMKQAKTEVFNLAIGPLFSVICCKIDDKRYLVIFNVHHAIFDGVSVSLLIRDWMDFYRQRPVSPLQAQYADYVLEKMDIPEGVKQKEINWWKDKLSGAPVQSNIPTDFLNLKEITKKSGIEVLSMDKLVHKKIDEFCKLHDVSKTHLVMTGLYVLINRITQQNDIVMGTVLNERTREAYEANIGDFNNYVPLRLKDINSKDMLGLLKKIKTVFSEAFSHQTVPFQELLRHIPFKRNRNQLPFYNVFLDSFNFDVISKHETNVTIYPFSHEISSLNLSPLMDLFFVLVQQNGQLSLTCFYNQNLLKPDTVKNYLEMLDQIIKELIGLMPSVIPSDTTVIPSDTTVIPSDTTVILSEAKDLHDTKKILRFAQDDCCFAQDDGYFAQDDKRFSQDDSPSISGSKNKLETPGSPLSSDPHLKQSLPPRAANRIARERLFVCIPGADGQNEIFNRLFPNENILVALPLPSMDKQESVEILAEKIINRLEQYPGQPMTLVGLSTGGIIAFEVLQQLKQKKSVNIDEIVLLDSPTVSGTANRISSDMTKEENKSLLLLLIVNYMLKYFGSSKLFDKKQFTEDTNDMSYEQKEAFVYTWIKTNSVTKLPAFNQFSLWMKQIKTNLETILNYQAVTYEEKDIKVTYISSGQSDEHALASLIPDLFQERVNKVDAWAQLFPKIKFNVKQLENTDHFSLFQGENIVKLREILMGSAPLSYGQERMYFAYLLNRNIPSYNCSLTIHLQGDLNIEALEKSCQELINRHKILSSTYQNTKGNLYCQNRGNEINFHVVPMKDDSLIKNAIIEKTQQLFDLEKGPVVRFTLFVKSEKEYVLHVAIHHIVMDGASYEIFIRDLGILYSALSTEKEPKLPSLMMQYSDFAIQQRDWVQTKEANKQLDYWKNELKEANTFLHLPVDKERLEAPQHHMKVLSVHLPKEISTRIIQFSKQNELSLASCFLSVYQLFLAKLSGQLDFVIGVLTSARTQLEIENLIGFFINILPIRTKLPNSISFIDTIKNCNQSLKDANQNQEYPIEILLNELKLDRKPGENPLFQCAFVYQNYLSTNLPRWQNVSLSHFEVDNGISNDDLVLEVRPKSTPTLLQKGEEEFELLFKYNTDLFYPQTAQQFANRFLQLLSEGLSNPTHQWDLQQGIKTICIASNFTVDPVKETLQFWMSQLDFNTNIEFSPYNQLMQALLDANSSFRKNKNGINIALIRLEDWLAQPFAYPRLKKIMEEFIQAVQTYALETHPGLIIGICPPSPQFLEKFVDKTQYEKVEETLTRSLEKLEGVYLVTQKDQQKYWVKNYYDAVSDVSAHIPYTRIYFSALGTLLARKLFSLFIKPYKVIVLDGDNTLWKGVLGEDGIQGVKIEGPYLYLQEFMLKQYQSGMILALCTKNNETDIEEFFHQRKDTKLRLEHFAAKQVSWKLKSEGLKQLAQELNLSLSNFIFIDDNRMEVAEVRANCPQVLALCLPKDPQSIPEFLNHVWVFDHLRITETDKKRTQLYQENTHREKLKKQVKSFKEFIENLNLEITITPMQKQDRERVVQLTQRTTQFNMTGTIKKENDLSDETWVIHVKDRFGSYGLTGVVFYELSDNRMIIKNFLLSCRVLGKGVEHFVVSQLGKMAKAKLCDEIVFQFHPSERNKPAKLFLQQLHAEQNGTNFVIKTEAAIGQRFNPDEDQGSQANIQITEVSTALVNSEVMEKMGTEWVTPEKILQCIHQVLLIHPSSVGIYQPPKNLLEENIAKVFCQLLHVESLSVTENFFELGATSLLMVHAQSALSEELKQDIPLLELFNHPSVRRLAEFLSRTSGHSHRLSGEERAMLELAARRKRNGI